MARDHSGKQSHLRERIAHLAARIMAEDGVDDFGYAKRKAARQAGATDARAMPDNREIEAALALYRQLYQKDEHADVLARLRKQALTVMATLGRFNPHLTGSVLSGVAGRHSDIEIQLFADSAKDVEIFLLNQGIRYRASQLKVQVNRAERLVPSFSFERDGTEIQLAVFDREDVRHSIRTNALGRPLTRAPVSAVEALLKA
ncbi:MAG: hypothetical protein IT531_21855 [Burkholderiales bacterium]|nr:hypothetical protein [Burkholderiales bacterium]